MKISTTNTSRRMSTIFFRVAIFLTLRTLNDFTSFMWLFYLYFGMKQWGQFENLIVNLSGFKINKKYWEGEFCRFVDNIRNLADRISDIFNGSIYFGSWKRRMQVTDDNTKSFIFTGLIGVIFGITCFQVFSYFILFIVFLIIFFRTSLYESGLEVLIFRLLADD
jgi:hypothetical protein